MATKMILPMLGQTMEEGTIIKWFKQEGDTVEKGEPLLEVMTDKVNMEVESPDSGVLRKITAQVDDVVPIMGLLAIIGTADEPIDDLLADDTQDSEQEISPPLDIPSAPETSMPTFGFEPPIESPAKTFISPRARRLASELNISLESLAGCGTGPNGRIVERDVQKFAADSKIKCTPLAAKIAEDKGLDLREVVGTGLGGKIVRDDVLGSVSPAPSFPTLESESIPFTGIRKMVADNVAKSAQTAPHVTLTTEVDMTEAVKLRKQVIEEFERKYGTRLTFTDLIVKAATRAILDHPMVNSSLQGNEIRIAGQVNMGLAVALEGGLIVPVLHNADKKSLLEISTETKTLIEKARTGKASSAELSSGTFTITNLGAYGIDVFDPIITPGQAAILGVCRIAEKPVVFEGEITIRSIMNLCLSFDHRILDGAPAAQFLARIKELLESPYQLLI